MTYKRKEIIGDCTLYLGDCLEVMPMLGRVDAVVTDPPYGIGAGRKGTLLNGSYTFGEDNEEYVNAVAVPAIIKCLDLASVVLVTPGNRHAWNYPKPDEIGCIFNAAGAGLGKWGFNCIHPILFYGKDPWNRTRPNSFSSHAITEENGHPCPKPIKYMEWMVARASKDGQTILDPFMGSGTTGVACAKMGRKFIGIELEPKYFDIACRRIEDAYKQPDMFVEQPKKAEQQNLLLE